MASGSLVQVGSGIRHIPLPQLSCDIDLNLGQDSNGEGIAAATIQHPVIGGFIGSGQLAWRAAGPRVEIVDIVEPGCVTHKAAWTFGAIMHNAGARVTAVCGVGLGTVSQVAIGIDLGRDRKPQGLVALLSLHSSRVTRVFHFTHKVTSLCMVSGGEVRVDPGTLAPELRPWHGIIAVGTAHGTLHLLDLALDLGGHKVLSDELSPATLRSVTTPDSQAELNRINAVRQRCHPTMCLSDRISYNGHFQLVGPDDSILFETASQFVSITAVSFIPQLASLVVGYNFGAFQIINLSSLTIDCASPYEDSVPPVHSFACQEPENDPKNFVYLWLCRSWGPTDKSQDNYKKLKNDHMAAMCTMYAMNYDNKVWIEGHGLWYQGLASISPRFEFTAIGGLGLKGQPAFPSSVCVAMTVQQTSHNSAVTPGGSVGMSALATPDEDSGPVPEKSLCLFGWAGGMLEQDSITVHHYLAVFDINQWYQAQMPSNLKLDENHLCPYMSFHELDRVPGCSSNGVGSEVVLGAAPRSSSWARHISRSCNESDWFPSSLSYDCFLLTSESLMEYECLSTQQCALNYLASCGPSAVVNPVEAFSMCSFAGLINHDTQPLASGSSMMAEREALLNVALDGQLIPFLTQCVSEFSEGCFTNLGCSLPSLLDWAWSRVSFIKATNDSLCMPLFDMDCGAMSPSSITTLEQNLTSLAALTTIMTHIRDNAQINMITLKGAGELENQVQVVGLLMLHLSVVLWFYYCGLLSHSPVEDVEECHVPFPGDLLHRIYKNRRSEIKGLSSSLTGNEILLIDSLLEDAEGGAGGDIKNVWSREEYGDGNDGMYPPPSLHALLDIFLLHTVTTTTKHRIVQYLFLDLASLLSDGYVRVVEELVKYPSSFCLSPSHIKLTQAFWLLDHKDFQEGLKVLLDPLVNTADITPSQHQRIIKAFLFQGEHSRALTYNQIRRPPRMDIDDIRLHLTLLLANGLINEAFLFQRNHRLKDNTQDLLNHLFTGCEQLGKLESIIHLPLSPVEEEALVSYLQASSNKAAHDYLLVYYLKKDRYKEAALLQESLRGGLGLDRKRQGARSALVHAYLTHLPDVTERLASNCMNKQKPSHKWYAKPQPLSAKIRQAKISPISRSGIMAKMMNHTPEAQQAQSSSMTPFTPFRNHTQRRRAYDHLDEDDTGEESRKRKRYSRDVSHIVFPSRMGSQSICYDDTEEEVGLFTPAAKRSRKSLLFTEETSKLMESIMKRSLQYEPEEISSPQPTMSLELLSLLQTPKVTRKKRSFSCGRDSLIIDTPQSILKVKQSIQRPISPSASSDISFPLFPRISTSVASAKKISITEDAVPNRAADTSLTPKQLRFHLPKNKVDTNTVTQQTGLVAQERDKYESILDSVENEVENDVYESEDEADNEDESGKRMLILEDSSTSEEKSLGMQEDISGELDDDDDDHASGYVDMQDKSERSFEVQEEDSQEDSQEEYVTSSDLLKFNEAQHVRCFDTGKDMKSVEVLDTKVNKSQPMKSIEAEEEESVDNVQENSSRIGLEITTTRFFETTQYIKEASEVVAEVSVDVLSGKRGVLRNPFSGVPTPRQALPGFLPMHTGETSLRVDFKYRNEDQVPSYDTECDAEKSAIQDTTTNETFYSFSEEETSKTEKSIAEKSIADEEKSCLENLTDEEGGAEKSTEVEECDLDFSEANEEEKDEDTTLHEEEIQDSAKKRDNLADKVNENQKTSSEEEQSGSACVNHRLNDSEYISPLQFSDSESENEEQIKSWKSEEWGVTKAFGILKDSVETKETNLIKGRGPGASVDDSEERLESKRKSSISQFISDREEEMITEALSGEDSFVLNLNASEQFSPIVFSDESDSEEENKGKPQLKDDNSKEVPVTPSMELSQIISDDVQVAIGESAEENSMEANVPEEHSVEACIPKEAGKVKQLVMEGQYKSVTQHAESMESVKTVVQASMYSAQVFEGNVASNGTCKENAPGHEIEGVEKTHISSVEGVEKTHISSASVSGNRVIESDVVDEKIATEKPPQDEPLGIGSITSAVSVAEVMENNMETSSQHAKESELVSDKDSQTTEEQKLSHVEQAVIDETDTEDLSGKGDKDSLLETAQKEEKASVISVESEDTTICQANKAGQSGLGKDSEKSQPASGDTASLLLSGAEKDSNNAHEPLKDSTVAEDTVDDHSMETEQYEGSNSNALQTYSSGSLGKLDIQVAGAGSSVEEKSVKLLTSDSGVANQRITDLPWTDQSAAEPCGRSTTASDEQEESVSSLEIQRERSRTQNKSDSPSSSPTTPRQILRITPTKPESSSSRSSKVSPKKPLSSYISSQTEDILEEVPSSPSSYVQSRSELAHETKEKKELYQEETTLKENVTEDENVKEEIFSAVTVLVAEENSKQDSDKTIPVHEEVSDAEKDQAPLSVKSESVVESVEHPENVTPLRRSRRRSSISMTPVTPRRSSRVASKTDSLTPAQASSQPVATDTESVEKISKSTRKISEVPTPVTKTNTSTPGTDLATPSRRLRRVKPTAAEVNKVTQKLLSSPDKTAKAAKDIISPESPATSKDSTDIDTASAPDTPGNKSSGRSSRSQIISLDATTPNTPSHKSPGRRSSRLQALANASKEEASSENKHSEVADNRIDTPVKRVRDEADNDITPSKRTPGRSKRKTPARLTEGFEGLETIKEDSELVTKTESDTVDLPIRTPTRRGRRSSVSDNENDQGPETPSVRKLTEASEIKTPTQKRRRSVSGTPKVREEKTPSSKVEEAEAIQQTRSSRKQRNESGSESDATSSQGTRKKSESDSASTQVLSKSPSRLSMRSIVSSPAASLSQKSPSTVSTRSSVSSPRTSVKDTESSEEEGQVSKKTKSRSRSLRLSTLPDVEDVLSGQRKTRRTTLSSLASTASSRVSVGRRSVKSLKLRSEDSALLLTPEEYPIRRSRVSKKSYAGDASVLIINESNANSEEITLESGLDHIEDIDADGGVSDKEDKEIESPDIPLILLDGGKKGRRAARGSLARKLMSKRKRKPIVPRRSVHSLKLRSDVSSDPDSEGAAHIHMETTAAKRLKRSVRRPDSENSVLEIESEDKVVNVIISEGQNLDNKIGNKVTEKIDESKTEKNEDPPIPHFTLVEPEPVISSRKSRALESLMGEAVEFLFSPPQPHGRIVKTHAKVEKVPGNTAVDKADPSMKK